MFDLVERLGGSISAEHGIGRLKAARVRGTRRPGRTVGDARDQARLDPKGILNPGKVLA